MKTAIFSTAYYWCLALICLSGCSLILEPGETGCEANSDCPVGYCIDGFCVPDARAPTGTSQAENEVDLAGTQSSSEPQLGRRCRSSAQCDDGLVCELGDGPMGRCIENDETQPPEDPLGGAEVSAMGQPQDTGGAVGEEGDEAARGGASSSGDLIPEAPVAPLCRLVAEADFTSDDTARLAAVVDDSDTDRSELVVMLNGETVTLEPAGTTEFSVPLSEGENRMTLSARDPDGGECVDVIVVRRDSTPPRLILTMPALNALDDFTVWTGTDTVTFRGRVNDENPSQNINVRVDGRSFTPSDLEWVMSSFEFTVQINSASQNITVEAVDAAGNVSERIRRTILLDNSPPELIIQGLSADEVTRKRAEALVLEGRVIDRGMGLSEATVTARVVDESGQERSATALTDTDGDFALQTTLFLGLNRVSVSVQDYAGNVAATTFEVAYRPTCLDLAIQSPSPNTPLSGTRLQVSGTVCDDVLSIEVAAGLSSPVQCTRRSRCINGDLFSVDVPLSTSAGSARIRVTVTEVDGETIDESARPFEDVQVVVDRSRPFVRFRSPSSCLLGDPNAAPGVPLCSTVGKPCVTDGFSIRGTASDPESGIASLVVNGTPVNVVEPEGTFFHQVTGLTDGQEEVVVVVTNNAGLQSQGIFPVNADTSPPEVGIVSDRLSPDGTYWFRRDAEGQTAVTMEVESRLGDRVSVCRITDLFTYENIECARDQDCLPGQTCVAVPNRRGATCATNLDECVQVCGSRLLPSGAGQYTFTDAYEDAAQFVSLVVSDEAGNVGRGELIFSVDSEGPEIVDLSPPSSDTAIYTADSEVSLSGKILDAESEVFGIEVSSSTTATLFVWPPDQANSGVELSPEVHLGGSVGSDLAAVDIPLVGDADVSGIETVVTIRAVDFAGNETEEKVTWIRDIMPPLLTVTSPIDGRPAGLPMNVTGTVNDGIFGSGVSRVEVVETVMGDDGFVENAVVEAQLEPAGPDGTMRWRVDDLQIDYSTPRIVIRAYDRVFPPNESASVVVQPQILAYTTDGGDGSPFADAPPNAVPVIADLFDVGRVDVFALSQSPEQSSTIYFQGANGAFQGREVLDPTHPAIGIVRHAIVADMSGNGRVDVLLGAEGGMTIQKIVEGEASTIGAMRNHNLEGLANSSPVVDMTVADFFGKGRLDALFILRPDSAADTEPALFQSLLPTPRFFPFPDLVSTLGLDALVGSTGIHSVDWDQDGLVDLIATGPSGLTVWNRPTANTFNVAHTDSELSGNDVVALDVEPDGDLDLLVATETAVFTLRNDGQGGLFRDEDFIEMPFSPIDDSDEGSSVVGDLAGGAEGFQLGDDVGGIDGAGGAVLAVETGGSSGSGESTNADPILSLGLHVADVDGDARDDLLVFGAHGVSYFRNTLDGFEEHELSALGFIIDESVSGLQSGDIDGDGDLDFVVGTPAGLSLVRSNASQLLGRPERATVRTFRAPDPEGPVVRSQGSAGDGMGTVIEVISGEGDTTNPCQGERSRSWAIVANHAHATLLSLDTQGRVSLDVLMSKVDDQFTNRICVRSVAYAESLDPTESEFGAELRVYALE